MGSVIQSMTASLSDIQTYISQKKADTIQSSRNVKEQVIQSLYTSVQGQKRRIISSRDGIKQRASSTKREIQNNIRSVLENSRTNFRTNRDRLTLHTSKWKEKHVTSHRVKLVKCSLLCCLIIVILIPTVLILLDVYHGDVDSAKQKALAVLDFFRSLFINLLHVVQVIFFSVIDVLWYLACSLFFLSCEFCKNLWEISKIAGHRLYLLSGWSLENTYYGLIAFMEFCLHVSINTFQFLSKLFHWSCESIYVILVQTFYILRYLSVNLFNSTHIILVNVLHALKITCQHLYIWGEYLSIWGKYYLRHVVFFIEWVIFETIHGLWFFTRLAFEAVSWLVGKGAIVIWEWSIYAYHLSVEYLSVTLVYLRIFSHQLYEMFCVALTHTKLFSFVAFEYLCVGAIHLKHLTMYLCELTSVGWVHFLHGSEIALLFAYDMSCQGAVHFVYGAKVSASYLSEFSYRAAVFSWEWSKILSHHVANGVYYGSIYAWEFSQEAYVYLCGISQDFNRYAEAWSKLTVESASEAIVKGLEWSQVYFEQLANASYYWSIYLSEKAVIYTQEGFALTCEGLKDFIEFLQVATITSVDFIISTSTTFAEKTQIFAVESFLALVSAAEWTSDTFNTCYDTTVHVCMTITSTTLTTAQHVSHVLYQVWGFVFPWSCFILDFLYYTSSTILTFLYNWSSILSNFVYYWTTFFTTGTAKALHFTLNKCLVRSLCIILVTLLHILYQIIVYLLQFIAFLFYIVFLFLQEIFSYILGAFNAIIAFFYQTVLLLVTGFKLSLKCLVACVKLMFGAIIFVLRHVVLLYVYLYNKYCVHRETIFLTVMYLFNVYHADVMTDRKRSFMQMIKEEQDVVDGRKTRRKMYEMFEEEADFGLRLLLAETEEEALEAEIFLGNMEMDLKKCDSFSNSDQSETRNLYEQIQIASEPPISMDTVDSMTASPGPILRMRLGEGGTQLSAEEDIPYMDEEQEHDDAIPAAVRGASSDI